MSGAMYETGFWLTLWVFYISFSAISSAITHLGVSMGRGVFSSIFPAVTSTGGIRPSGLFIRRFYYTFKDRFRNLHALKYGNCFLKSNRTAVKNLHTCLLTPTINHTIKKNFIQLCCSNFVWNCCHREQIQVLVRINQTSRISYIF